MLLPVNMSNMDDPREVEYLKNYKPSIDDLKMKSPALISENYVEKAKYDEAVRQRDELKEALMRLLQACDNEGWNNDGQDWEEQELARAAIKNTER